jgi:hypothetical protein
MLPHLSSTLHHLLTREMPITNGEIDIAFDQPTREWSARLSKPTLNPLLYHLRFRH